MRQLVENYHALSKAGKLAAAIDIGGEIGKQETHYKPHLRQWSDLMVDYDTAHEYSIRLQKSLEKAMAE